jgi:hypothetical protein
MKTQKSTPGAAGAPNCLNAGYLAGALLAATENNPLKKGQETLRAMC